MSKTKDELLQERINIASELESLKNANGSINKLIMDKNRQINKIDKQLTYIHEQAELEKFIKRMDRRSMIKP